MRHQFKVCMSLLKKRLKENDGRLSTADEELTRLDPQFQNQEQKK